MWCQSDEEYKRSVYKVFLTVPCKHINTMMINKTKILFQLDIDLVYVVPKKLELNAHTIEDFLFTARLTAF